MPRPHQRPEAKSQLSWHPNRDYETVVATVSSHFTGASMDPKEWRTYVEAILHLEQSQFKIEILKGGFLNSTIRLAFIEPIRLAALLPTSVSGTTIRSLILKHAPPHMASDPSTPLSTFRQTREARALKLVAEPTMKKLWEDADVLLPELIWHDEAKTVLWITDLGPMISLTDYLRATVQDAEVGSESPAAEHDLEVDAARSKDIGMRVGRAFAHLHLHTLNPGADVIARFKDPLSGTDAEGDIAKHQSKQLMELMEQYGGREKFPDAAELAQRIGLGTETDRDSNERVLSMGDIWPGSILLRANPTEMRDPDSEDLHPPSTEVGLIDWEFFGISHPGGQMGTLAGHLSVHGFELDYPPKPLSPLEANIRRARLEALVPALIDSYIQTVRGRIACTSTWQRSVLCSWGCEVGNAPGFWADLLSDQGKSKCVEMGAEALRAAGAIEASVDLGRTGLPGGTLRKLLIFDL